MNLHRTAVGLIHSPHRQAKGTPIQPRRAEDITGAVDGFPQVAPEGRDLDGFDRIWLLYWFGRSRPAQPEVIPFLAMQKRGAFATRAPSR